MSESELKSLERYLQELEALKSYARVKAERDSLDMQVAQLRQKVAQLEAQLKEGTSTRKEFATQLSRSQAEVKALAHELAALREFRAKLPQGDGLSLAEMRTEFLKAGEGEIERRARARLEELERELRSQLPARVQERLMAVMKGRRRPPEIQGVLDARARRMADAILRDARQWPDWFQKHYAKEVREAVGKGLDAEFEQRVEAEGGKRLQAMKAGQWREYVAGKAKEITTDLRGLVRQLQGTWWFACERCQRRLALDIGPAEIGTLLSGATVDVRCTACTDPAPFPFLLSTVPHQVSSVSLAGLLQAYLAEAPSAE